jgi:hypothetical protein
VQPFSVDQASRTRTRTSNCQTTVCATNAEAINDILLLPFHLPKMRAPECRCYTATYADRRSDQQRRPVPKGDLRGGSRKPLFEDPASPSGYVPGC